MGGRGRAAAVVLALASCCSDGVHGLRMVGMNDGPPGEFTTSYCIAHDGVQWSSCSGILGAEGILWDPAAAVPMHEPKAADAAMAKGPLSAISRASIGCQLAARRHICAASWGECIPAVDRAAIMRSASTYEFMGQSWPAREIRSYAELDQLVQRIPRQVCADYHDACSEAERRDAYSHLQRMLKLFRAVAKRTEAEAETLARNFFLPNCTDDERYTDRERTQLTCALTGAPMPEPPLTSNHNGEAQADEAWPQGWCAGDVPGFGCCSAQQQEGLRARAALLVAGYGEDAEVTDGECGVGVRRLLCLQGCDYATADTVKRTSAKGVQLRLGANFCEQLSRSCGCHLSPQTGTRLESVANGSAAMCEYVTQALLPLGDWAAPKLASVAVDIAPEGAAGAITLGAETLVQSCEWTQGDAAALADAPPPAEARCTTHGAPHAPVAVGGDGGLCKAFLPPGAQTCCSAAHMQKLDLNLRLMGGVLKSSACGHEFSKLACTTLCSPSQWAFASTSYPARNGDGSLNVTVTVADEWCGAIVDACASEIDPRDQVRFADKFSDPLVMCAQIGPYLNMMLAPNEQTPRYRFEPRSEYDASDAGEARMLSDLRCADRAACEDAREECPLAPEPRAPYAWSAAYEARGAAPPAGGGVRACAEHAGRACCSPDEAEQLANWSGTRARSRLGMQLARAGGACAGNVSALLCGVGCDAAQRSFVELPASPGAPPTAYILAQACAQIFRACGGAASAALQSRGIADGASLCAALGEVYDEVAPVQPLAGGARAPLARRPPPRALKALALAASADAPRPVFAVGAGRAKAAQWGASVVQAAAAVTGETCPLADDEPIHAVLPPPGSPPGSHGLELCVQHEAAACCYAASEHMLASKLQLLKRQFGGAKSACLAKVLALTCETACSPRSSYFTHVQRGPDGAPLPLPDGSLNASYYMTAAFCDDLYASCRGAFSEIFGDYLGSLYPSARLFCESFSVTSDPTYKPGPGKATLMARVGAQPETGLAIGDPDMPGGGQPEPVPDLDAAIAAGPQAACLQTEAAERQLGFCKRFAAPSLSCCEAGLEATIGGNLTEIAGRLFGHGCCFARLSDLVCGLACSPRQADYMSNVTANADGSFNVTIYIDPALGDQLWADCASHKMLATTTVETYFEGPADLLARIASGVQTKEVKSLEIRIGRNPTSGIGVGGGAEASAECHDPPPLSELSIGFSALPTDPLLPPGLIPMYLLLFAAVLAAAFCATLCLCGGKLLEPAAELPSKSALVPIRAGAAPDFGALQLPHQPPPRPHADEAAGAPAAEGALPRRAPARRPSPPRALDGHMLVAEQSHADAAAAFGEGSLPGAVYEAIEEFYYALGHFFASRPSYALVPLAVLLTWAATQLGGLSMMTKPSELWVAQGTPSIWQAQFVQQRFGAQRHEVMIITTKVPGGDVLFPEALREAAEVEAQLRSLTFEKDGARASLEEVCSRVQCRAPDVPQETTCLFQSPLKYWRGSSFETDADLYATVSNLAAKDECGIPILRKTVLGGLQTDASGRVLKATSLMVAILLEAEPFAKSRAWEYGFLEVAAAANARARHVQVSYMAQVSQDEEVARLASADVPLLVGSYAMMIVYVVFAMWGRSRSRSHVLLGLTGVALVICSIVVMLGLTVLLRVPFTPVSTQVLPFLLLGIGVDNIFILTNTYIARLRDPRCGALPADELVGTVLAQVGPTITLTSTATTLAFAVGSLSCMPAVKYFCQQCVLGFAVNLLFQLTVFSVAIAADVRRVRARRLDIVPCLTPCFGEGDDDDEVADGARTPEPARPHALGTGGALTPEPASAAKPQLPLSARASLAAPSPALSALSRGSPRAHHPPPPPPEQQEDALGKFMAGPYVDWLCRPATQAGVVLAFGLLLVVSLSHALRVEQGLEIGEVLPKGSYMATFFDRFQFYSDIGPPVYLVASAAAPWPHSGGPRSLDFADHATQDSLGELVAALELSPWIKPPALDWLGDFQKWALVVSNHTQETIDAAGRIPPDKFYPWLGEFLAPGSDFAFYANYLSFHRDGTLESAQVMGFHQPLQSTNTFVQAMLDMRALCNAFEETGLSVFPYSEYHIFYEQYAILVPQASKLLFSAIVVILLVMSLLLGNVGLSLPVLLLLTLNQIDLIGIMQMASVHMNGISIINLVMAIGLSVEYLAHIASTYNMARGEHVHKLRVAMASVGSSVVSGGLTTLLGVVVLAFAKYPVFQIYYFRMYLSTVLCGSLHGLVLLPVVLGLINRPRRAAGEEAPAVAEARRERGRSALGEMF